MGLQMSEAYRRYTQSLEEKLGLLYAMSERARGKALDPSLKTECRPAKDLADLVEGGQSALQRVLEN